MLAYGIGLLEVAQAMDPVGCEIYFVEYLEEAILIKENLQKLKIVITLDNTHENQLPLYLTYNVVLTIANMETLNVLLPLLINEYSELPINL